jgi:cytochrome c oxidase subunit 1
LLFAFLAFLYNVIMTIGIKGLWGIFTPAEIKTKELLPEKTV